MNPASIKSAYKRYAPVYDALFGAIFHPARETIVQALDARPGQRILEVGVGTGLSLSLYPEHARVTGIDLCKEMLDKARTRVREQHLDQVEALLEMDAEDMQFPDSSFDKIVAMYVVSVAANPLKLVDEMRRVCKPGGDIFIVNHFRSNSPVMGTLEGILSPMSKLAGFRTNMELEAFLEATGLEVVEVSKTNVFGYWKMLRCRNAV
ncbi:MAG: class I SAM-dependent methyltransferase [Gammaproteobacteria bacterium]